MLPKEQAPSALRVNEWILKGSNLIIEGYFDSKGSSKLQGKRLASLILLGKGESIHSFLSGLNL